MADKTKAEKVALARKSLSNIIGALSPRDRSLHTTDVIRVLACLEGGDESEYHATDLSKEAMDDEADDDEGEPHAAKKKQKVKS